MDRATHVTARVGAHRALASASRVQILDALQRSGAAERVDVLADAVGLHPNTTREHLDTLVAAGLVGVTVERSGARGRPRRLYRALERGTADQADPFVREHLLRVLLAGYGRATESPAADAEQAGRLTGEGLVAGAAARPCATPQPSTPDTGPADDDVPPQLRQLAALEQHFESLGFAPDGDPVAWRVDLRRCPVRRLALEHTDVVCSVHLGLARGVLAATGGPLVATRLEPFVGPAHCVVHLAVEDAVVDRSTEASDDAPVCGHAALDLRAPSSSR